GWADELRNRPCGPIPAARRVHWTCAQGRTSLRAPSGAADQILSGHQPEDRQRARPYHSAEPPRRRRRGDRSRRREFIARLKSAAVARAQQFERGHVTRIWRACSNAEITMTSHIAASLTATGVA